MRNGHSTILSATSVLVCVFDAHQCHVTRSFPVCVCSMLDFRIDPPLGVKDTPKTRPLGSLAEAGAFVERAMRLGRPPPWRNMYERLRAVRSEEVAIEVIGALRELLDMEDLLVPPKLGFTPPERH
jgi:hypothetical protein